MKLKSLTSFAASLVMIAAPVTQAIAQEEQKEPATKDAPKPSKMAAETETMVKALSDEQQKEFFGAIQKGAKFLGEKRNQEALDQLHEAEALLPNHPAVLNYKGSAYVNLRDFDRAAEYFDKLISLYPDNWQGDFNRTEMDFVRHEWKASLDGFTGLMEKHSDVLPKQSLRLLDYKIAICHLKLGDAAKAKAIVEKYGFFDDSPIYYYGNAALAFQEGNDVSAHEWINNAKKIYSPGANAMYADALFEAGWLQML